MREHWLPVFPRSPVAPAQPFLSPGAEHRPLPAPACPWPRRVPPALRCLVWDRTPCRDGIWGDSGSQGGFLGVAGFPQPAALVTSAGDCQGVALQRLMPAREKAWTKIQGGRSVGAGPGWGGWGPVRLCRVAPAGHRHAPALPPLRAQRPQAPLAAVGHGNPFN